MLLNDIFNQALTQQERLRWESALARCAQEVGKGANITEQGDHPRSLSVVLSGWVARYREMADGRRHIVALYLPGDLCDLDMLTVQRCDSTLTTLRPATVARLPRSLVVELLAVCPNLGPAMAWSQIVAGAVQREWLASTGQRTARERVAHLMCELYLRQRGTPASVERTCDMFLTQSQIAELTGLTQVHINRTIQDLRRTQGVEIRNSRLFIPDFQALARLALFDGTYLHRGEAAQGWPDAALLAGGEQLQASRRVA